MRKAYRTLRARTLAGVLCAALMAGCGAENPEALVASAKDYLAKKDTKAAVIQLKNALQKNPELAEARLLLGRALLDGGDTAAAEKELRKAYELKAPADEVVPALARSLMLTGASKKLVAEFATTELGNPQARADLKTTLAQAHLVLGNIGAAKEAVAAALAAQPDHGPALLVKAQVMGTGGDLTGALALVESTLVKDPGSADAWQLKGDVLLAQGQVDAALDAYRKALEVRPDVVSTHGIIISLLLRSGRIDEAKTQLDAMLKVAPKHPQTYYLKGLLAHRQKNYAAARDALQELLRLVPDNLPGLLLAGSVEYELKSYIQAEAHLQKVLQRLPQQQLARRMLVGTYLRMGQPAKALDLIKPVLDSIEKDSDMLALAGEVYVQNGDAARASEYFAKAAELDPKNSGKRTAAALTNLAKGGDRDQALQELEQVAAVDSGLRADLALIAAHLQQRQADKALKAIDALQKKQPNSALPHNLRGAALLLKGDVAGASKNFEAALALDPAYVPAAANLARLDLAQKKPDDARKRFEGVLAKDPKNHNALLALAELKAQTGGSADEVAGLIGKAVAANPALPGPRIALISHHLRSKEPKKALAAAQEALAAVPDNPEVLDALGLAQQAAGDGNQAITTYNKLAALRPEAPLPLLRLADIHVAAKDYDAAKQSLSKALTLKPDLLEAQRAMMALERAAGRMDAATRVARDVQRQRPKEPVGYLLEGDLHASKKAWNEALAAYRNGLRLVGGQELAIKVHATLVAGGKASEAEGFAANWLKEHPKDDGFRLYLAELATARKDYASAARQYRSLIESQPNNALMLNNLAWVSFQLKDPKGMEYAERAYKAAPEQPAILDTYGTALLEKGETARGLEMLRKAVGLAPDAAAIRLNLAKGLLRTGDKPGAKAELEVLAKLGDKFAAHAEVMQLMQGL